MTPATGAAVQAREERLEILRLDYEMTREDERTFQSIQAALVGASVVLTATLSAIMTGAGTPNGAGGGGARLSEAPEPVLVMLPLVPLALVAFAIFLGAISTVRTYYLRALEAELQKFAGGPMGVLAVPPGGYTEFVSEMVSMRRGIRWYPFLAVVIFIAALLIFGGFAVYIYASLEETAPRVAMGVFYLPLTAFLVVQAAQASAGGRGLFADVARSFLARRYHERTSTVPSAGSWLNAPKERSLGSYLLLPRLEELPKVLFAPAVFGIAALALGGVSGEALVRALIVWFVLEYLVYEARYQWNDVRGVHEDLKHDNRESRKRLPLGANPPESTVWNVRVSLAVIVVRLVLAIAVPVAVGLGTLAPSVAAVLGVFGVAIPYEWLRAWGAREDLDPAHESRLVRAIWVAVGGGYAVRGVMGLYLAGVAPGAGLALLATGTLWAYGVMFVTLTWALEAITHSDRDAEGRLIARDAISRKPHVGGLLVFLEPPGEGVEPIHSRPLLTRGPFRAPWNTSLIVCAALGTALGAVLANGGELDVRGLPLAALGLTGGALLAHVGPGLRYPVAALVTAIALVVGSSFGWWPGAVLVAMPWFVFSFHYAAFRASSYHEITQWAQRFRSGLGMFGKLLLLVIAGRRTAESLGYGQRPDGG